MGRQESYRWVCIYFKLFPSNPPPHPQRRAKKVQNKKTHSHISPTMAMTELQKSILRPPVLPRARIVPPADQRFDAFAALGREEHFLVDFLVVDDGRV